jgi:16S rRNA G1207 methylase RsmC
MNTTLSIGPNNTTLHRFPASSKRANLQAWGSEDELVLNEVFNNKEVLGNTLILNDEFGALGCVLCHYLNEHSIWQSDSYISHCALRDNLSLNKLNAVFTTRTSIERLSGTFDTVLLRLPKNNPFLQHTLTQLQHVVTPQTNIIALGKVKAVTSSVLSLFETYLGKTRTSLAVKKARLIYCSPDPSCLTKKVNRFEEHRWQVDKDFAKQTIEMCNLANVFASKQLDIGARFMLDNLPPFHNEQLLDLGCGNGVLGLASLMQSENASVTFVDESYMAVESAKRSVALNAPEKQAKAAFVVDNCLDSFKQNKPLSDRTKFDRVLCNPPFHQQNTLTDHIAWQMFNDAKTCLKVGGKLWVVGNRHLAYHDKLKRVFGGTKVLASNRKFVILEAVKR